MSQLPALLGGSRVISLPIRSHLPLETADRVDEAMHKIHGRAEAIQAQAEIA